MYLYRLVCAVGIAVASVMVITTMQDCPKEVSRGKWGGFNSFLTSFAILAVTLGLARLPGTLAGMGYSAVDAGRLTFWVGAGMSLVAAGLSRFAFAGGQVATTAAARSPLDGFAAGIRAAPRSPRLALSYASAFAARGDLVVIGAFYSLWFRVAGGERGLDSAEALKAGGISLSAMLIEPYSADIVAAERRIALGKKSGLDSIRLKAEELGIELPEERVAPVLAAVKNLGSESRRLLSDDEFRRIGTAAAS